MKTYSLVTQTFAALLVLVPAAAHAADSTWSERVRTQLQHYDTALSSNVVDGDLSEIDSHIPNGVLITGTGTDSAGGTTNAIKLTGTTYQTGGTAEFRGMRIIGIVDGLLNTPYNNTTDRITSTFNFEVIISGGSLEVFNAQTDYGLNDASDNLLQLVGSSGYQNTFTPGNSTGNFSYVDNFGGTDAPLGTHIIGDFVINFEWTGFSPTDTLEFNIPSSGFVIQQTVIPEPAHLAILGVPSLLLLRKRR